VATWSPLFGQVFFLEINLKNLTRDLNSIA
jgi:hypothetical protein